MRTWTSTATPSIAIVFLSLFVACGDDPAPGPDTGGMLSAGAGVNSGGSGGFGSGGTGTGGVAAGGSGGTGTGGTGTGGVGTGGTGTGGTGTGGMGTGGTGTGGMGTGGTGTGGMGTGGTGMGTAVPATFATVEMMITVAPCFGAGCHNDEQNPLDLRVDEELHTRLTSRISANCGDIPVVNPGNPQESALVKILKEPCGETPRMPFGCINDGDSGCVPPDYIAAIEQWIADGAPQQ